MGKCKKCNEDINTDDTLIECEDFILDKCIVVSEDIPYLGIEEGQTYMDLINELLEKIKEKDQVISQIIGVVEQQAIDIKSLKANEQDLYNRINELASELGDCCN